MIISAYLLLCIVLGGSAQGVWGNLALQVLGIALVAFAILLPQEDLTFSRFPCLLLPAGLFVILLQLIPLPPDLWARIPGRSSIAAGFDALGYQRPSLPVSETPYASVMTLMAAIPAIAIFLASLLLRPSARLIAMVIIGGTMAGILLGTMQVVSGPGSWAYLYRITNLGAVGFFANQNHLATLMLTAIPMIAAVAVLTKSDRRTAAARYGGAAALLLLLLVGIALNASLAAFALVIPVLLASIGLLPASLGWRRIVMPAAILSLAGGLVLLASNPVGITSFEPGASAAVGSRELIWRTTVTAIEDNVLFGTGLGSFERVYHQYEDPAAVNAEYVNHAHNDYLELVLELGLAGALLIILFVAWWLVAAVRIWRSRLGTPVARAATIATAAILAHSLVDFPLRTAAISAIFGALAAIMALDLKSAPAMSKGERRPVRHVKLG